jgi:murein tripeptide amidase MpaA
VHSGETSSSFALEGMINFLISADPRAKALREIFVFIIVPIMNPDGVFHGTYRMDTCGHNLNRFYNSAQSHKQPSVFAVQTIVNYYSQRIVFFMDLHSHPHPNKGSFIYGNCLGDIEDQTETQMYAKILSIESQCFGYNWCNFSSSQMNSRDLNEILTKDGSARVQVFKILNIPFAYTM